MEPSEYIVWSFSSATQGIQGFVPDENSARYESSCSCINSSYGALSLNQGRNLLVASLPHSLVLYDTLHFKSSAKKWSIGDSISCLASSPCSKLILGGTSSGRCYAWESSTGRLVRIWNAHLRSVTCMQVTDDSCLLLTCGEDSLIHAWLMSDIYDLASNVSTSSSSPVIPKTVKPWRTFDSHSLPVRSLSVAPGGGNAVMITTGDDASALMWHIGSGTLIHSFSLPTAATCVVCDQICSFALVGLVDGRIMRLSLLNFHSGVQKLQEETYAGHSQRITSVQISDCDEWFVSASHDGTICRWDVRSRALLSTYKKHTGPVNQLVLEKAALKGSSTEDALVRGTESKTGVQPNLSSMGGTFRGGRDYAPIAMLQKQLASSITSANAQTRSSSEVWATIELSPYDATSFGTFYGLSLARPRSSRSDDRIIEHLLRLESETTDFIHGDTAGSAPLDRSNDMADDAFAGERAHPPMGLGIDAASVLQEYERLKLASDSLYGLAVEKLLDRINREIGSGSNGMN